MAILMLVLSGLLVGCRTAKPESRTGDTIVHAARVDRVLARLLPCFPEDLCRQFGIISSAVPNASIDGRGTLKLTTGLLELAETDDLLAFALAHELVHASLRHPQRVRRIAWLQALVTGAAMWAAHEWTDSNGDAALAGAGIYVSTALLGTLPAMRRMEAKADLEAKEVLRRSGYRTEVAAEFWRLYAEARPSRPRPLWLSAHPTDQQRIERLMSP